MASWENINNVCGFKLNDLELFHVRSLVQHAKAEFSTNFNLETTQLSTFFLRIKNGSKKYSKILSKEKVCLHNNKGLRKRLKLSTLMQPFESRDCNFYNLFKCGFLTIKLREFLFKFNTGTHYTNAMISNFVAEQDPACSRCVGGGYYPPLRKPYHIFSLTVLWLLTYLLSELNNLISNNTLGLANVVWLGVPEKKYTAFSKCPWSSWQLTTSYINLKNLQVWLQEPNIMYSLRIHFQLYSMVF